MDWVLGKVVDQSDCGASLGKTKITDLVFAGDAVILAESLEVLVMALEALHKEARPLGLEVSWLKTKVQVFGDLLDETVQSVYACGEDIEILESCTYLGSAVYNDDGSRQEVLRRIGIAHGVMDSLSRSIGVVESWNIAGMITCQISDCTVRLNRGLLPAYSVSANFGYVGMWHATLKSILPIGLYLPLQKSPIPLNRYDDESSLGTMRGVRTPDLKQVAKALYSFSAQNKREISFNKGDVIFIRRHIDKNWYEGEHRGSVGIFPCNYVEIVPYDSIRTLTRKPTEGQARARFNFQAQTSMEMSLSKGELVVLTRRVDENWYEGRIGNRKGIFPVSYVDTLMEPGADRPLTPSSSPMPRPALPAANLLYNGASSYSSPYSTLGRPGSQNDSRPYNQSLTVNTQQEPVPFQHFYGASLGKIKITDLVFADDAVIFAEALEILMIALEALHEEAKPLGLEVSWLKIKVQVFGGLLDERVQYRALYNYKPQNDDELELMENDLVMVMEKCDDGWFVGTSRRTGLFGTFPGNYVEKV
ncbi:Vinexin [Chionoecetes opilio]|uniref:Vinexin n=1 Tax=Chionoecetes opilio TaxID=41210 RepID=A0A8J4XN38_CHIOP|nr:Vinexin [Chionoecetes opilio]